MQNRIEALALFWEGILAAVLALVLLVSCVQIARAGEAYRYTTAEGVVSFTDDIKRVPARYQADAKLVKLAELDTYARLTITSPSRPNPVRIARLRQENSMAAAQRRVALNALASRTAAIALPIHATREMRWVEGVLGYSGKRYRAVDVLRDGHGRVLATGLSEIGLGPGAIVLSPR